MNMRVLLVAALALGGFPAIAQPASDVATAVPATVSVAAPAVDEAKLAISRKVAARLVPDGVFKKVMAGTMDTLTGGMMDQVLDMPLKSLIGPFLKNEDVLDDVGPGTLREISAILDPAFKQRTDLGMKAMVGAMSGLMTSFEPEMREGMALAYANRFTEAELGEFDRFFASPSGAKFASESMTIMTDPAIAKRMQAIMPKVIEAMPEIMKAAASATDGLPKPRSFEDLNKTERAKLAELIGISEKDFKRSR
jgi:hypothetical protein